jgi:hypothetical protein
MSGNRKNYGGPIVALIIGCGVVLGCIVIVSVILLNS